MKKKTTIWIAVLLILLTAFFLKVAFTKSNDKDKKKDKGKKEVDAFVVKPSLLIDEIEVSGSLLAFDEVELKNEVAGRVVKINLPEGRIFGYFMIILWSLRFAYEFLKENQVPFEDRLPLNMGQFLSIPLVIIGIFILIRSHRLPKQIQERVG